MRTSFVNKSTNSKGKRKTEKFIQSEIDLKKPTGYCLALQGHALGYPRHMNNFKSLGFKEQQVITVELDEATHLSHERYKNRHSKKNELYHGFIEEAVITLGEAGFHMDYVEADGNVTFGAMDLALIKSMLKYKITAMTINGSLRGTSPIFRAKRKEMGFGKRKDKLNSNVWREQPSKVIPDMLNKLLKGTGYTFKFKSYKGKNNHPMYLIVLKKGA